MSAVQVRAAVEQAFRDFELDGVPSSGKHEPVKSEIRFALGRLLESVLSSIGAGIVRFRTKALMDADNTRAEGILAYVYDDATEANNNVYQWNGAAWEVAAWYFAAVAGVVQPLVDDAEAARDMAQNLLAPFEIIEQGMRDEGIPLYGYETTATTSWDIAAGFGGVAFVVDGADLVADNPDLTLGTLTAYLQAGATAVRMVGTLYRRTMAHAAAMPGAAASDTIIATVDFPLADIGLTAGGPMRETQINFSPVEVDDDYSYCFAFETREADNDPAVIGVGQGPVPAGKPARYAGFFRNAVGGPWANVVGGGFGFPAVWSRSTYIDVRDIRRRLGLVEDDFKKVERSFPSTLQAMARRDSDGSSWPAADAHFRWSFGVQAGPGEDIAAGQEISTVGIDVELSATIDKVRLRIFRRPTDDATAATIPGNGPDDVQVYLDTMTLAELGLTATGGSFQALAFPFTPIITAADFTYLFEFTFYSATNITQGAGIMRSGSAGAGLTAQQRGFYDAAGVIAGTLALGWQVGNLVYTASGGGGGTATLLDTRDRIDSATGTSAGLNISLEGVFNRAGSTSAFASDLALVAPENGNVVNEAVTLTSPQGLVIPAAFYNPLGKLAHANVSAVTVRDAGTNAVLVLNTDYLLNPYTGVVSRANEGANRPVKVDYHWSKCRYDVICIHAETKAISAVQGTPRDTDPGEFVPAPNSPSLLPLFNARVADGFDTELIPVWYLDGTVHRDLVTARDADYANQRRALEPLLQMARRGETIRVAFMGDSIGGVEGGLSPNNAPNTPARDRPGYFLPNIGNDLVSTLPLFDQGDGGGQIHTHLSSNWGFVQALRDLGATVEYYNFCIGGTASGAGDRQGKDPVLRAAVWAVNPHVLGTHYGMNETGSNDTEANLTDLFAEARDHGVLCVFAIGQPRPSTLKPYSIEAVRKTWRATRRAAEFFRIDGQVRGAYFAPERLVDDAYLGGMGLSLLEYGAADRFHHPGIREFRTYSREIAVLVRGQ